MSATAPAPLSASDVARTVDEINQLVPRLPKNIPMGEESGKLYQTMLTVRGENEWATFNRRFDILFGEDCRDANGRLLNVSWGAYGLDIICKYLHWLLALAASESNDMVSLPWDAMQIKLERLRDELQRLM